ncbi:hypothetical protein SB394_21430 [Burkholderia sp. BCCIQ04A]|uniref:LysR family transcriptional regulator n=1 Tax=Burkholderia anthinoferrum TaxID=3090833 RepID=A0ABU5WK85_9BURK|nr:MULTISPECIES: hypothetical protein [Burkholderia]MEB2507041.1 hypothetical protein [Burkholderia anthinoferrum]MEB2532018.1 hypothetical protein [Burkholderia anthinoferrum]MEB2564897.1 hypothetical protein [Burkholderia anthinoferrum]MEB2578832.1 hypothetical protein [Burkholderia anthinoferrum]MCA8109369.1 hypothetical protein [Burkholderia sp. AU36459]
MIAEDWERCHFDGRRAMPIRGWLVRVASGRSRPAASVATDLLERSRHRESLPSWATIRDNDGVQAAAAC